MSKKYFNHHNLLDWLSVFVTGLAVYQAAGFVSHLLFGSLLDGPVLNVGLNLFNVVFVIFAVRWYDLKLQLLTDSHKKAIIFIGSVIIVLFTFRISIGPRVFVEVSPEGYLDLNGEDFESLSLEFRLVSKAEGEVLNR